MSDFPSEEAVRAARMSRFPHDTRRVLAAAYAVDEPKIREDERARIVEALRGQAEFGGDRVLRHADFIERMGGSRD